MTDSAAAFAAVADELYGLDPDDFTATRNARAKDAAADGDRDLADRIKALPKPSVAAWAVNVLARQHADRLDELLDLGTALRDAQADLDAASLRQLTAQRRKLVAAVALEAAGAADDLGHPLGAAALAQLEQTLTAAMVDADAAEAVRSGSLVRALEASGLEVDTADAAAVLGGRPAPRPTKRPASKAARSDELAAQRQKRREQADAASRAADEAESVRDELAADARSARTSADDAAAVRDGLQRDLDELREQLEALGDRLGEAERHRTETRKAAEQAERELTRATRAAASARDEATRLAGKLG